MVLVDSLLRAGGGERLAVEGAIRLDRQRFRPAICISRWTERMETEEPAATLLRRLREAEVEVIPLRRRSRANVGAWLQLFRYLRRNRVGLLHAHLFGSNLWAALLGPLARVPAVVAHEHMWSYSGGLRAFLERNVIARRADAFVAVSEAGRRAMIERERIPASRVVLIRNGAPSLGPGDGARARRALGIDPEDPVVVSVGHLRAEKAFEVLLRAAALLRRGLPRLRVLIAGEGPERASLESLAARLGLGGTVSLLGQRDDVADLLACAQVAVCCSDFEGGPLSVLEYMGAGLPVVATEVGGVPELIEDESGGLLVPPRDPDALAAGVESLLADPELGRRLGERGRLLRETEYGIDPWVARIEDLYSRLLADATGPAGGA